jgi:hypothetical protein
MARVISFLLGVLFMLGIVILILTWEENKNG